MGIPAQPPTVDPRSGTRRCPRWRSGATRPSPARWAPAAPAQRQRDRPGAARPRLGRARPRLGGARHGRLPLRAAALQLRL